MPNSLDTSLTPLTVLIPVHNGENFLAETLASVLAQDHPAVEVLVINDGSTDGTQKIAESFGDRIRLVNRENAGVSASRNYGLSIATTDWVALMDHDDLWEKDHLKNLATAIARDPQACLCYSGARRMVLEPATGTFRLTEPLQFPGEQEINAALMDRCAFITSSCSVRRAAVFEAGGFDSYYLNLQDWDLWLRMLHRGGRFLHAPGATLLYRVHPAGRTNNPLRGLRFSLDVVRNNILPHLSTWGRMTHGQRVISRFEAEAAMLLRENGMDGALPMMLRSLLRDPFFYPYRYTVAAHMLLRGYPRKAKK